MPRKTNKNKSKKRMRKRNNKTMKRKQRGGNKNCNYVPTFFLPPGGMYDVKSTTNGLGKGYYYGVNQCLAPGYPISTVDLKENKKPSTSSKKQKGGSQFRSIKDLARNTLSTIEQLYSEITTKPFPMSKNPNVMKQPINKKVKKERTKPMSLKKIMKDAKKKVDAM